MFKKEIWDFSRRTREEQRRYMQDNYELLCTYPIKKPFVLFLNVLALSPMIVALICCFCLPFIDTPDVIKNLGNNIEIFFMGMTAFLFFLVGYLGFLVEPYNIATRLQDPNKEMYARWRERIVYTDEIPEYELYRESVHRPDTDTLYLERRAFLPYSGEKFPPYQSESRSIFLGLAIASIVLTLVWCFI